MLKLTANHETLTHKASEQAEFATTVEIGQFKITDESVMETDLIKGKPAKSVGRRLSRRALSMRTPLTSETTASPSKRCTVGAKMGTSQITNEVFQPRDERMSRMMNSYQAKWSHSGNTKRLTEIVTRMVGGTAKTRAWTCLLSQSMLGPSQQSSHQLLFRRCLWRSHVRRHSPNGCQTLITSVLYTNTHSRAHFSRVSAFRHTATHCAHSKHFYASRSDCKKHFIKSSLLTCLT